MQGFAEHAEQVRRVSQGRRGCIARHRAAPETATGSETALNSEKKKGLESLDCGTALRRPQMLAAMIPTNTVTPAARGVHAVASTVAKVTPTTAHSTISIPSSFSRKFFGMLSLPYSESR